MKILNPEIDLDSFFKQLNRSFQKALLIDYDGTLAPFHVDPSNALPYPGVREILNRILQVSNIRLAIVSGRWTEDLLPLLKLNRNPEIWGSHGLERLKADGAYEIQSMDEKALKGLVAADEWIEKIGLSDRSEKKPGCLAIHWRGLDEQEVNRIRRQIDSRWPLIAESFGLIVNGFDGGMELRVPGRNKGDAVKTILNEMGKETVAAYLGDDSTDEDAFKAIKEYGIGILVREEIRPTAADLWIKPPSELLSFLSGWIPEGQERC